MNEVAKIKEVNAQPMLPADPMISMIERIALDPNSDLDKLDRMLQMKERIEAQNAKVSFASALSAARADIPPIIKDATVDFTSQKGRTHYKHETLAGIARQIDPILSENGLSYRFRTNQNAAQISVTCIISHRDGYSEETSLSGSPDTSGNKNGFQAVGSAVTYLQRYTLKAALGLSAEIDDDAQGATQRKEPAFNPQAAADRLTTAIRKNTGNREALNDLWAKEKSVLAELPEPLFQTVKGEFSAAAVQKPAPSSLIEGDEIPY